MMNSKTTGIWLVIAATLAAAIFFFERYQHSQSPVSSSVLPGLQPSAVTSVQIIPADAFAIRADRTNGDWLLTKPIVYPAQPAAIESLLDALQKLTAATKISAAELRGHKNAEAEFGFENPQYLIVVAAGDQTWQLKVGHKTAPGDQVFLRVVGVDGAFVADDDWLKFIPQTANDWRSTAVVNSDDSLDWILLTNRVKNVVMEFRRDPASHLWRMIRPLPARANNEYLTGALQKLFAARVTQFVSDDPKADLNAFGLQPAALDLWLGRGTNRIAAICVGKNSTNDSSRVFARRADWHTIFTTPADALSPWSGSVNDFRDPLLLELAAPVAEIEVRGKNDFTLQRNGSNDWSVAGEKYLADADNVQSFIKLLAGLRIADFVKDVVTAPDLQTYGLAKPARQIILRSAVGDTNAVIARLLFGATQSNEVFVKRGDEDFIYAISTNDFDRLPEAGWEFRDRRIWNFSETNVASITLRQNGKTRQLLRDGLNEWSLAAGSQGIINPPALEETAHRLGGLTAYGWLSPDATDLEQLGWNTNNLQIAVALKNGEKLSVDFISEIPQLHSASAVTVLDGKRWAFVFPPILYQFVLSYLTIPANVP